MIVRIGLGLHFADPGMPIELAPSRRGAAASFAMASNDNNSAPGQEARIDEQRRFEEACERELAGETNR